MRFHSDEINPHFRPWYRLNRNVIRAEPEVNVFEFFMGHLLSLQISRQTLAFGACLSANHLVGVVLNSRAGLLELLA
jgi:hypothetical protein